MYGLPVRPPTDFKQSALVLGAAQLGGPYGIANATGGPDDRGAAEILALAAELGVTHVDTARAYGESERRVGAALESLPLNVITKIAPDADPDDSVRKSLATLGTPSHFAAEPRRPPTFLFHRTADAVSHWQTLRRYRHSGAAERIGVSVQTPSDLHLVLDLPDLGYVQLPCNALDRRWDALDLADRPDLVVTVRGVYLQGLLAAGRGVRWPVIDEAERDRVVAALDGLAAELGRADRADLCVAYVLSLPWVTSVVIGAETPDQLRRNADLAGRPPLTADERSHVAATLPRVPDDLLDPPRWGI